MNLYGFLLSILFLAVYVFIEQRHFRRTEKLLNRLMAKNYQEFRYYEEKWPKDLDALEKVRKTELGELEKEKKEDPDAPKLKDFEDFADEVE